MQRETTTGGAIPEDDGQVVARVTSFAPIRHQALLTLDRVLAGARVVPRPSNANELRGILNDEGFRAGSYDARTLGHIRHPDERAS